MASRSRLRLWRQNAPQSLAAWEAAPRAKLSATRNTSRIAPSTRQVTFHVGWRASSGRETEGSEAPRLGTPILTLGSFREIEGAPRSTARGAAGWLRNGLSFAISRSKACSRNTSFHRRENIIASRRRVRITIAQAATPCRRQHESFRATGVRRLCFVPLRGRSTPCGDAS